jgi:hypothetical protein
MNERLVASRDPMSAASKDDTRTLVGSAYAILTSNDRENEKQKKTAINIVITLL